MPWGGINCSQSCYHGHFPVRLLQVCWQIYHEAALKPFAQPTFDFDSFAIDDLSPGAFLTQLVPVQARAIAHMRLTHSLELILTKTAASRLKGLKHVEVHFQVGTRNSWDLPKGDLIYFTEKGGVEWLRKIGLKPMRFSMLIISQKYEDDVKASVLEWMKAKEEEILGVLPKPN